MGRQERVRPRARGGADAGDVEASRTPVPRRPVTDTSAAARMLERIRRVLRDQARD